MKQYVFKLFALSLLLCWELNAEVSAIDIKQGYAVIINDTNSTSLTKRQLIDLYMGRFNAFPNGEKALPIDIASPAKYRAEFYLLLVNMPLARINAYWSRVSFTGRATPPISVANTQAAIQYIANTPNAIGYVPISDLIALNPERIKVILELYE